VEATKWGPTGSVAVMNDYPRTLMQLESRLATDAACRDLLAVRWPQLLGVRPYAGWSTGRGLWMCAVCGHQRSLTAGTIFQDTRTPLTLWFRVT
jgi:hypothetical protein